MKGKRQVTYKLCAAVYQQSDHFITRFKDENGKYYQQDGRQRNGYASAVSITSRGFPFSCVHDGKESVLYLVFYVEQDEQDEQDKQDVSIEMLRSYTSSA